MKVLIQQSNGKKMPVDLVGANPVTVASLGDALNEARWVRFDFVRELTLAWFGGHGIHVYDSNGKEVAFWNTGDYSKGNADLKDIQESMDRHIREGGYPD